MSHTPYHEVDLVIQKYRRDLPDLARALEMLNGKVRGIDLQINPLVDIISSLPGASTAVPGTPTGVTIFSTGRTVRITWTLVADAASYEIRKGASWDSASFQTRTVSTRVDLDPVLVGTHTYLIRSLSASSVYSDSVLVAVMTVPPIPPVAINARVIDNNVLLSWDAPPVTFDVRHYQIYRNGVLAGTQGGTFFVHFEQIAGVYTYKVLTVDIAGNVSADSEINVALNQPPDFQIQDVRTSLLGGTRTNVYIYTRAGLTKLFAPTVTETWAAHFTVNGWTTPQAQVSAGFPVYAQPSFNSANGIYEEVINYGVVFPGTIATITFNFFSVTPAAPVTILVKMATSLDGSTWSAFTSGASQFLTNFQYIKFRLEFDASDTHALIEVWNVTIYLSVKREVDGGEISAVSTDVTGTPVLFNKSFKDIDTITATPKSNVELKTVVDFVDVPNPTGFKVYLFNTAGARVSGIVEWASRGIV